MSDVVTFTLSLPVRGSFNEIVDVLKLARDSNATHGNMDVAQALHTLVVLAEGGLSLIAAGAAPVLVPSRDT